MQDQYSYVLVPLDNEMKDLNGVKYPERGIVEANDFSNDKNILHGLSGFLDGHITKKGYFSYDINSIWSTVKIENDSDIVKVDDISFIKFRIGMVMRIGSLAACVKVLKSKSHLDIAYASVAATSIESSKSHVVHSGIKGTAISKNPGLHALTLGDYGRACSEHSDSNSISFGTESISKASGDKSLALALGENSIVTSPGNNGLAVSIKTGCRGSVGPGGRLILSYETEDGIDMASAVAGKDIEPDTMYHIKNGKFVKCG